VRQYLTISNMRKAAALGGAVTLMSVPRMLQGGMDLALYVPAALAGMTLVSGAATAWSDRAGMHGLFPERRRLIAGLGVGSAAAGALALAYLFWPDPLFRSVIIGSGKPEVIALQYPATVGGVLALALWGAGFETTFFRAAAMSFFGRLTGRLWMTIALAVALRIFVTCKYLAGAGIVDHPGLFLAAAALTGTISSFLFARYGLPAPMLFSAVLALRLLAKAM